MKWAFWAVEAAAALLVLGCATVLANRSPEVSIQSDPVGAEVYVNGEFAGTTPVKLRLAAKGIYLIGFYRDGFEPKTFRLNNHAGGTWIALDVLCGFWPLIVDLATGAHYELDTRDVTASLVARTGSSAADASNPWKSGLQRAEESWTDGDVVSVVTRDGCGRRGRILVDKPNDFLLLQLLDGSIARVAYRELARRETVHLEASVPSPDVVALPRAETPLEPLFVFQGNGYAPDAYDSLVSALERERPGRDDLKVLAGQYRTQCQQNASFRAVKPWITTLSILLGGLVALASVPASAMGESSAAGPAGLVLCCVGFGVMVVPSPPPPIPSDLVSYYNLYP